MSDYNIPSGILTPNAISGLVVLFPAYKDVKTPQCRITFPRLTLHQRIGLSLRIFAGHGRETGRSTFNDRMAGLDSDAKMSAGSRS